MHTHPDAELLMVSRHLLVEPLPELTASKDNFSSVKPCLLQQQQFRI